LKEEASEPRYRRRGIRENVIQSFSSFSNALLVRYADRSRTCQVVPYNQKLESVAIENEFHLSHLRKRKAIHPPAREHRVVESHVGFYRRETAKLRLKNNGRNATEREDRENFILELASAADYHPVGGYASFSLLRLASEGVLGLRDDLATNVLSWVPTRQKFEVKRARSRKTSCIRIRSVLDVAGVEGWADPCLETEEAADHVQAAARLSEERILRSTSYPGSISSEKHE
jgi:hypothetical protein